MDRRPSVIAPARCIRTPSTPSSARGPVRCLREVDVKVRLVILSQYSTESIGDLPVTLPPYLSSDPHRR